jgi:hypothetical protein
LLVVAEVEMVKAAAEVQVAFCTMAQKLLKLQTGHQLRLLQVPRML